MRLLITGAGGQIGCELIRHARTTTQDYLIIPLRRTELDITQLEDVVQACQYYRPDVIINTAAYTKVDCAETAVDLAHATNVLGVSNIAKACHKFNIPLVHFSTDYIFDGKKQTPYVEDDPASPTNIYGVTKWQGEEAIRKLCPRHVILRTSWVYGLYGGNFVKTMLRLAREKFQIQVIEDQVGCPTAAQDIADLLLTILPKILSSEQLWGTYHFCSGAIATSWYAFAQQIISRAATITKLTVKQLSPIPAVNYPSPARRPSYSLLCCDKIVSTFSVRLPRWVDTLPSFIQNYLTVCNEG